MSKERPEQPGLDKRMHDIDGQVRRKRGHTLGFKAFEKISAVEGMTISRAMKRDIMAASADHLSPDERSRFILAKYGKK